MMAFALFKAACAVVSVALAAGLLARDHGLKANRLIAAFLFCNAYWALLEFFLYRTTDVEVATRYFRFMAIGWVPLGTLCAHASLTLSTMERRSLRRLLPLCYAGLAIVLPVSIGTDWVIREARRISIGWYPEFGPGMIAAYLLMSTPLVAVLASWRTVLRAGEGGGQHLLARIVFFGISSALVCGTVTAVALPILGIEAFGFTTALLAGVGLAVTWTLRRFGHALISAEAFAREILDTLEDGVILVDDAGRIRDANRAFLRWVGEPEARVLAQPVDAWLPELSGDAVCGSPGEGSRLGSVGTRLGETVPVVVSRPVPCDGGGRHVGHAYVLRDRREIVSLQRQLVVSARLAAVGDLSAAISASISEPAARLQDEFTGLALDWDSGGDLALLAGVDEVCAEAIDEGRELVDECVEGADRIFSIVREVAGFSSESERDDFAPHALDQIVRRSVRIAQVQAPAGVEIEVRVDPDVKILCHYAEIERVATNLLVNALHALGGEDGGRHVVVAVAAQDGRALLHVEDDGCGIDPEVLDRIFDPFFTTKPVGKGTGLGLAISYHIVKAHGGEIRVSSEPGRGTSVAVELPRAPIADDASADEQRRGPGVPSAS